jgi:putative ABC transport system permease protein
MLPTHGINSALIPSIDNMKNLGLVWIHGVMTGLLLEEGDSIEAASILAFLLR